MKGELQTSTSPGPVTLINQLSPRTSSPFWFTGVGAPPSEPVMITGDKGREVGQPTVVSNAMAATVPPPYAALRPNEMEADMPNRDRRTAPESDGSPGSPDRL